MRIITRGDEGPEIFPKKENEENERRRECAPHPVLRNDENAVQRLSAQRF